VVGEVDARFAEDDGLPDLLRAATGRAPVHRWLERAKAPPPRAAGGHAVAYLNAYREGVVRAIDCLPRGVVPLAAEGRHLCAPPHPEAAPHLAYAVVSSAEGASAAYEKALERVGSVRFDVEWST
jgi:hypothetical protein